MSSNNNLMICRACLCDKQELLQSFLNNQNLIEIYSSCTNLRVNINDNLPMNLCSSCINKCVSWNYFKEMCTQNESVLKNERYCKSPVVEIFQPIDDLFIEDQVAMEETKPTDLPVKFEEVNIKNELESLDEEISNCSRNNFDNAEVSSDAWDWDPTAEIFYLDDKSNKNIKLNEIKNTELLVECAECGEKFPNKTLIKIHMRQHIKIAKKLNCSECERIFLNESNLLRHISRGTCKLKCYICGDLFKSITALKLHRTKHSDQRPHKCKICDRNFTTIFFLTGHMRMHTGERPFPCTKCDKSFMMNWNLRAHQKTHLEQSNLCSQCGKTFPTKNRLKLHMFDHTNTWPFKCEICQKGMKSNFLLQSHMRLHTGETPFQCKLCNQTFSSQSKLKVHILSHTGERPYKCTTCEKTYKEKGKLNRHMRTHTNEKPYICQICYRSFYNSNQLRQHKQIHSDVKPFKCDSCDKTFYRNSHLVLHSRIHKVNRTTDDKPHKCNQCEKSYMQKCNLTMHMESHANEKSFNCTMCEKSFNLEVNLKIHMKNHEPLPCSLCTELYENKTSLARHMQEIHGVIVSNSTNYYKEYAKRKTECSICNKLISLKSKSSHMKTHSTEKPFKCQLCPSRSFVDKQKLNQHMSIHSTEKPYKCDLCDKAFKRRAQLTEHTRIHTGQAPTCKLCNKSYAHKTDLVIHMRTHTGEKPYTCTVCQAAFDSQAKFRKHKRIHDV